jgi:hypothetical protein
VQGAGIEAALDRRGEFVYVGRADPLSTRLVGTGSSGEPPAASAWPCWSLHPARAALARSWTRQRSRVDGEEEGFAFLFGEVLDHHLVMRWERARASHEFLDWAF